MASSGVSTVDITSGSSHAWTGLPDVVRAVYSQEIRMQVQPVLRFAQFAQHRLELGTQPGNQITMLTFNNLTRGGKLTQGTHIETKAMSTSTDTITVYEYGNGIAATEYLLRSSFVDVMAQAVLLLANDAAWVYDNEFRKVNFVGTQVLFGNDKTTQATAGVINATDIRIGVETLATAKTPKFSGVGRDAYICIVHPRVGRQLRADGTIEGTAQYAGGAQIFQGELGRFEDVIFVETTMAPYIDASGNIYVDGTDTGEDTTNNNSATIYQSLLFGADAYGFAEGLPIELRDNGVVDFGRERALAWYGISGYSILDDNRMVRIESI